MAATRARGALALTLLALVACLAPVSAQVVQPDFWGTNGRVTSIARGRATHDLEPCACSLFWRILP